MQIMARLLDYSCGLITGARSQQRRRQRRKKENNQSSGLVESCEVLLCVVHALLAHELNHLLWIKWCPRCSRLITK